MDKKYQDWCKEGAMPHIIINKARNLTLEQYLEVLNNVLHRINSEELEYFDDNTIGNKDMGCNWGTCDDSPKTFPKNDMHIFPKDFDERGRCSSLPSADKFTCPLNDNPDRDPKTNLTGCFHTCTVFQRNKPTPTREVARSAFEEEIEKVKALIQSETT